MKRIMTALILAGMLTVSTQVFAEPVKAKDSEKEAPVPSERFVRMYTEAGKVNPSVSWTKANDRGKELLKEYDVQSNQSIRFPFEAYVFETHGAETLTSLEEVHGKYPDWSVPEKLGNYRFVDFTLYRDRTDLVFPDQVPPPKDEIEVLTDREPSQYYLCYKKGDSQFRIDVMPIPEENFSYEEISHTTRDMTEWQSHPRAFFIPEEENNTSLFHALWISPEPDGKYAFFIHKITGPDCMESEDIPFTDKEADELYQSILKEFPN